MFRFLPCYQRSEIPMVGRIFLLPYTEEIFSHDSIKGYFSTKNIESMRSEFKDDDKVPDCIEEAAKILALQYKHHAGYARGLMSTLRNFPLTELRAEFSSCQQQSFPVQVIWVRKGRCQSLLAYITRWSFFGMPFFFFWTAFCLPCPYPLLPSLIGYQGQGDPRHHSRHDPAAGAPYQGHRRRGCNTQHCHDTP